jgi:hypothetical protein
VAIAVGDCFLHKGIKAFQDQSVSSSGAKGDNNKNFGQEDKEEITTIAEVQVRQTDYGLQVACTYYAINRAFLSKLSLELLWEFQRVLLTWHKLLKLESTGGKLSQARHRHLAS